MKEITPRRILATLLFLILVLLILNIWSYLNLHYNHLNEDDWFFRKFNFDKEKNFPSIISSLILFTASVFLAVIGYSHLIIMNIRKFWWSMSFLFLFLAFDELLRIHEKIGSLTSLYINTSGVFHYTWVIPYGILVLIIGFLCIKPSFLLPKKILKSFIIAGAIYLGGALGVEMFTGWYIDSQQLAGEKIFDIPEIFLLYTLEELLEMLGASFFVYTLAKFLNKYKIDSKESQLIKNNYNV